MAKLHEYQGKEILKQFQVPTPIGKVVTDPGQIEAACQEIGGEVVIKAQAWVTGRARLGLIRFAADQQEAARLAGELLGMQVGQSRIDALLVEQKLDIQQEFYAGVIIDDAAQAPRVIFSARGGSGIEEISAQYPESISSQVVDVYTGLKEYQARELVRRAGVRGKLQSDLAGLLVKLYQAASSYHARAAEINPIALTSAGELYAADCRITIDDNAIYLFPQLGIEVAREFDRPPTPLEKVAWNVEKNDYRGTFFFIQMEQGFRARQGYIGFHGAGGGGSMMSMDAVMNQGFKIANFVDTSGNPPASKVYRAARIILAQKGIDGYFASGSGVASQEQFHSARGLVKAFVEAPLNVPAVIRLGGNAEDVAIRILERARGAIPAPVEGYGKDDSPDFCARRLKILVEEWAPDDNTRPVIPGKDEHNADYAFPTVTGGEVSFDYHKCTGCQSKVCVATCAAKILTLQEGLPVLNISVEDARRGKCVECLACEVECAFEGSGGGMVKLPIPGLEGV